MRRPRESPQNRFLRFYSAVTLRVTRIFPAFHAVKMAVRLCTARENPVVRTFPGNPRRAGRRCAPPRRYGPLLICVLALVLPTHALAQSAERDRALSSALMHPDEHRDAGATGSDQVRAALIARLTLSIPIAHAKFRAQQPIEDPPRERLVIAAFGRTGARFGLDPTGAEQFARALIEASKSMQRAQFAAWAKTPPAGVPPDLAGYLRPALDRAGEALLRGCALELVALQRDAPRLRAMRDAIVATGVAQAQADTLLEAIAAMRYRPLSATESTLDLIAARGALRVGLPGDYAPFGFTMNGAPAGIDVELARDLAASLGVTLRFVATSWSTLLDDLATQRFDVAMGGITRSLARAQFARFSIAYFADGKGAITRCADAPRFASFADIDVLGVRVIVNPGGSNEQFVRARIKRASITVHPDNITIFSALADGAADVMITDRVEAEYQAARVPRLCVALQGGLLSATDKAVLLPRDPALVAYVDLFLQQARATGRLDSIVRQFLPAAGRDAHAPAQTGP